MDVRLSRSSCQISVAVATLSLFLGMAAISSSQEINPADSNRIGRSPLPLSRDTAEPRSNTNVTPANFSSGETAANREEVRVDSPGSLPSAAPVKRITPAARSSTKTGSTSSGPVANSNMSSGAAARNENSPTKGNAQAPNKTQPPAREIGSAMPTKTDGAETTFDLLAWIPDWAKDSRSWTLTNIWNQAVGIWNMKVVDDRNGAPIPLNKVIIGLVVVFLGQRFVKRLSQILGTRVLPRLKLQKSAIATMQQFSYYVMLGLVVYTALEYIGFPMTVFTFFAGAFAVGLGFGSQNIVNNFISGLIMLVEQPIRVGDTIQIDGITGKVTEIGARSTRVTTGSNLEILIPNSSFLQGNVTNWTLSDDKISTSIKIGVTYGSPVREVSRLLLQAANENTHVLREPSAGVAFTNFGDHALEFELSFWICLTDSSRGQVESDLRFRIDELFAEHGIVFAYPQRDVHLNLLRPVEVKLSDAMPAKRSAA